MNRNKYLTADILAPNSYGFWCIDPQLMHSLPLLVNAMNTDAVSG